MSKAKISIIIPVYNVENYIGACIESVINQSYTDWELILIDDESKDRSIEVCRRYLSDDRIRLVCNTHSGVAATRNLGIEKAEGEYILFIDSDDTVTSDACEILLNNIIESAADICITGYRKVYTDRCSEIIPEPYSGSVLNMDRQLTAYIGDSILQGPCWKLFKSELIKENKVLFPVDMDYGEDAFFVYEYLSYVKNICVSGEVTYNYAVHTVSLSNGFKEKKYGINLMLNKKMCELCKSWGFEYKERLLSMDRDSFMAYINDAALAGDFHAGCKAIKTAALDARTGAAFLDFNRMNLRHKLIAVLIRLKAAFLIYLLAKINRCRLRWKN